MSETKKPKKKDGEKEKLPFNIKLRGFRASIKKFFRVKLNKFIKLRKTKEYQIPRNSILGALLDGIILTSLTSIIIDINVLTFIKFIPILGFGWFLIKKDILPEIRKVLASVNFIKIQK